MRRLFQAGGEEWIELSVSDNGEGIDKALLPRIFGALFTTKGQGKGNRHGSRCDNSIIQNHGGHILVDTQEGIGSKFQLLFPPLQMPQQLTPAPETMRKALRQVMVNNCWWWTTNLNWASIWASCWNSTITGQRFSPTA